MIGEIANYEVITEDELEEELELEEEEEDIALMD